MAGGRRASLREAQEGFGWGSGVWVHVGCVCMGACDACVCTCVCVLCTYYEVRYAGDRGTGTCVTCVHHGLGQTPSWACLRV